MRDKKVLDVGAGSNPELSRFVEEHGGMYVAADYRQEALDAMRRENPGARALVADAAVLPFAERSFDIAHSRFTLLHLSPEDQAKALKNMYGALVPGGAMHIVEFDFSTIRNDPDSLVRELSAIATLDRQLGSELSTRMKQLGYEGALRRFHRPTADHKAELLAVLKHRRGVARERVGQELEDKYSRLIADVEQRERVDFLPPDIVTYTVFKESETGKNVGESA